MWKMKTIISMKKTWQSKHIWRSSKSSWEFLLWTNYALNLKFLIPFSKRLGVFLYLFLPESNKTCYRLHATKMAFQEDHKSTDRDYTDSPEAQYSKHEQSSTTIISKHQKVIGHIKKGSNSWVKKSQMFFIFSNIM